MDDGRIFEKLDSLDEKTTHVLVGLARVEEQIKDVQDLRNRVSSIEKWRWTAAGALLASGTSLATQLARSLGKGA